MALNIPHSYATKIELVAQEQHITQDEALDRILQAGLAQLAPPEVEINVSYGSLFGAAKNGYGSREAVERAIAEMRNEW